MIVIDQRFGPVKEGNHHVSYHDLRPFLPKNVPAETRVIGWADIAFLGNGPNGKRIWIGLEIKTIDDLLSSMDSDKLQTKQLPDLAEGADKAYLLVIGEWTSTYDGQLQIRRCKDGKYFWWTARYGNLTWRYSQATNFLFAVDALFGVSVIRANDLKDAGKAVTNLYGWWNKEWDEHTSMKRFRPNLVGMTYKQPPERAAVANLIPRFGWKRAMAAAEVFSTKREMMEADEKAWRLVPGVGKTLAKEAVRFWRES